MALLDTDGEPLGPSSRAFSRVAVIVLMVFIRCTHVTRPSHCTCDEMWVLYFVESE